MLYRLDALSSQDLASLGFSTIVCTCREAILQQPFVTAIDARVDLPIPCVILGYGSSSTLRGAAHTRYAHKEPHPSKSYDDAFLPGTRTVKRREGTWPFGSDLRLSR